MSWWGNWTCLTLLLQVCTDRFETCRCFRHGMRMCMWFGYNYAPNFKEVDGAYWFRIVSLSRTVHARVLKFHIWIPHGKIFDAGFFSCPTYLPFWNYAPLNKIWMKPDACHILWTVHARVLKFHIWIPHGKIADPHFFSCPKIPFLELCPFEKIRTKPCQQDISKNIWARGLKLGQLIGEDE